MKPQQKESGKLVAASAVVLFTLAMQGCSALSCDAYQSYDDVLDSWLGAQLNDYESRNDNQPYNSMDRPQNVIQYAYNTPYYNYDGSQVACRTFLDVDRSTGEIVGWRYEGDCYMHGRCVG
jgi:hypothetical protein